MADRRMRGQLISRLDRLVLKILQTEKNQGMVGGQDGRWEEEGTRKPGARRSWEGLQCRGHPPAACEGS